jgi:hypothetical protein
VLYASREDSTRLLAVVTSLRAVASAVGRNALRVEERRPAQGALSVIGTSGTNPLFAPRDVGFKLSFLQFGLYSRTWP